ncbi:MAG: CBS domain-containing protein [Myxococcota bacterium]
MKTVRDVLAEKSLQNLITISATASIVDAAELMAQWDVGALLVMDQGELRGLVTERDCMRKAVATGHLPAVVQVGEVMATDPRVVAADKTTEECMVLMTNLRVRHLPVVWAGDVLGIVSIGDLVKDVLDDRSFLIEQLEAYIVGSPSA